MAKILAPIPLRGRTYRVLRLDGDVRGPRFLLRSEAGALFGLFAYNGRPTHFFAAPLVPASGAPNSLAKLDFFDADGRLLVSDDSKAPR